MVSEHDEQAMSRKERERERHREEMLEAAERVFARKGYRDATIEEIAQESEFAVGTVYNLFNNKWDLYSQVVERIARDATAQVQERVLCEPDPVKAVGQLVEIRLMQLEHHRGFFRVFLETAPGSRFDPEATLPEKVQRMYEGYLADVTEVFRRGVAEGKFVEMDPLYLALGLDGVTNAFLAYWTRTESVEPLAERVEKVRSTFLTWILKNPSA